MSENIENNNQENTPQPTGQSAEKQKVNKQKTKQKKTKIINILIVILVLGGLYFVVKSYFNVGNDKYTNAAQVESFINPINTRVSAYITEIRFVEHQYVKKGDTLLILDDREIQTQLGQAEATYMSALASKNATSSSVKNSDQQCKYRWSKCAGSKSEYRSYESKTVECGTEF
ncbi:multidrug resistance protein MdtN [Sphingobacterium spiritivorum]|uniref:Multidrug resistance protein MdtN n=1 Tax=Sphingobacterium spiritivorum TaxID=258 RepID=A0A380BL86_SPHSI|nr:biotin/lipoyl-binding protein [Sphingobacterium spiritivorum]SUJ02612.1 multidrug resistance protein MdtN [Sphingobacterium spiritivorum]